MPTIDLGGVPIPIFAAIFSAGWMSCWTIVVLPMKSRVTALEEKVERIETNKDLLITNLQRRLGLDGS